jgi:hypothetical protein
MQVISFGGVGQARVPSARSETFKTQEQRVNMTSSVPFWNELKERITLAYIGFRCWNWE